MPDPNEPKIIIDTDWKAQAQKEKERLAAQERDAAARQSVPRGGGSPSVGGPGPGTAAGTATTAGAGGASAPASAPGPGRAARPGAEEIAAPDFITVVHTIASQAVLYLGGFPDPQTGRAIVSLEHAKYNIDLLGILQDKTKGNLTPEEDTELTQMLSELRFRFVEISKAVAQMQAKAAMEAAAGGGAGGPGGKPPGGEFAPRLKLRTE